MDNLTRERFEAKIDTSGNCHVWIGSRSDRGYGQLRVNGRLYYAHRLAYEVSQGPIPAGLVIDHACHNRACVNPRHLQAVSQQKNMENLSAVRSSTGYRGVWKTRSGRYTAEVRCDYKKYRAGNFETPEAANEAAIALRNHLFSNNLLDRQMQRGRHG